MASRLLIFALLLIVLHVSLLHARVLPTMDAGFDDAVNGRAKRAKGHRGSDHVRCNTCKNVVHSALKTAHHFVGLSDVTKAAQQFCYELQYQDIIKDDARKECVKSITMKAAAKKHPVHGKVAYLRADDICMYVGSCNKATIV